MIPGTDLLLNDILEGGGLLWIWAERQPVQTFAVSTGACWQPSHRRDYFRLA